MCRLMCTKGIAIGGGGDVTFLGVPAKPPHFPPDIQSYGH